MTRFSSCVYFSNWIAQNTLQPHVVADKKSVVIAAAASEPEASEQGSSRPNISVYVLYICR
jgi:hypothetical protein